MRRGEPAQGHANSVREIALDPAWLVCKELAHVDYADAFVVEVDPSLPSDPRWWVDHVMSHPPGPVRALMTARNVLMKPFGVKRGKTDPLDGKDDALFEPVAEDEREIVMGTDDKHLNFRANVLVRRAGGRQTLTMATVVHYNNVFGRLYFVIVLPFHKWIVVPMTLRHAAKSAAELAPTTAS